MKKKAPVKPSAASDKTAKLSHLKKMPAKAKRGVTHDVASDHGAPVAQMEGREDFHEVYRPHGEGYGQADVKDVYRAHGKG